MKSTSRRVALLLAVLGLTVLPVEAARASVPDHADPLPPAVDRLVPDAPDAPAPAPPVPTPDEVVDGPQDLARRDVVTFGLPLALMAAFLLFLLLEGRTGGLPAKLAHAEIASRRPLRFH